MKEKILIVDDEKDIVRMLDYNLSKEGYRIFSANNGELALKLARQENPSLIILDLMLPGIDGLEVCKLLKQDTKTSHIPVIMVTARSQEADKVVGFELGADDYVTKPFSIRELSARIKAMFRRGKDKSNDRRVISVGSIILDLGKIEARVKDKPLELTAKEFELLKTLIQANGRVLSRDYLLDTIWGFDQAMEIQTRTVDVHIRTLRKKLKNEDKRIITVKNYGYRFEIDDT